MTMSTEIPPHSRFQCMLRVEGLQKNEAKPTIIIYIHSFISMSTPPPVPRFGETQWGALALMDIVVNTRHQLSGFTTESYFQDSRYSGFRIHGMTLQDSGFGNHDK